MNEEHQRSQVWDGDSSPPEHGDWYNMDVSSPRSDLGGGYSSPGQPMDIQTSPMVQEYPHRPPVEPDSITPHVITSHDASAQSPGGKLGKFGSLGFKKSNKWGLGGMFGHTDKSHSLPPVDEMPIAGSSSSTPSLKRTQSSSTDSRSLSEMSPVQDAPVRPIDPKKAKKEAEQLEREAQKQRRAMAEKAHRDQARAVMQKRTQVLSGDSDDLEWKYHLAGSMIGKQRPEGRAKSKHGTSPGPIRQNQGQGTNGVASTTVSAAAGRFDGSLQTSSWRRDERQPKARRREFDDDHSMSSSDAPSMGRMSALSFATVDSDPGPSVIRNRPSVFGLNRMTSTSSLRTGTTSFDDFPSSARSSNSFSVGESLAHDFHNRANVDGTGTISPPPMQMLSISPSPSWMPHNTNDNEKSSRRERPNFIPLPPAIPQHPTGMNPGGPHSPYELGGLVRNHPPSPGLAVNPIFKVVSDPSCHLRLFANNVCVLSDPPAPFWRTIIVTDHITTLFAAGGRR
jgi:meiosis induction protein kinase IME2/SME1